MNHKWSLVNILDVFVVLAAVLFCYNFALEKLGFFFFGVVTGLTCEGIERFSERFYTFLCL